MDQKIPEGCRLPTAKEYTMLSRSQPYSAVCESIDNEGNVERVWFDKENPVTE